MRNKGKDSAAFLETDTLEDTVETAAKGRKGVFGFDSGNKWINLSCVQEERPEAKELYSIYEIYHGAPDEANATPNHGFKANIDVEQRTGEDGIIQLDFHDEFETYESIYDEAGHIARTERKLYRLPKGEVNDRVDRLEALVGTDENRKMPEKENEDDQNLYGYVEDNCNDIKELQDFVGDWDKDAAKFWDPDIKDIGYAPTIAETIGDLNLLYKDYADRANNFKSLAELIGKMPDMYDAVNDKNFISITSAITKIQQNLVASSKQIQDNIDGINAKIGTPINNDSIYDHIEDIYTNLEEIEDILAWGERAKTVSQEIDDLDGRTTDLEAYRTSLEGTIFPAINNSISTLNSQTSEHYQAWDKASQEFAKTHEDIYAKLGSVPEGENIIDIIEVLESDISTKMGSVPEGSNIIDEINNKEEAIYDLIGEFDENSTVKETIDTLEENIINLIGEVPEESSVMGIVSDNYSTIINLIGSIPEESDVSTELEDLQNQIDDIVADLGTNSSETETAFSLIAANAEEISDINTILGEIGDTSVAQQIADIHDLMGEQVDNKSLSVRITETKNALSNYVTNDTLTNAKYVTESDLETVQNAVVEIAGDLETITNLKENIVTENTNLLQDIFARLVSLEDSIVSIKTVINTLHSEGEPPFPEVVVQTPDVEESDPELPENEATE